MLSPALTLQVLPGARAPPPVLSPASHVPPPSWWSLKWGPGLEVAYVRAEQSEQWEVM